MFWPYGVGSGALDELLGRFLADLDLDRMPSEDTVELLRRAMRRAGALGAPHVGTEHLLAATVETGGGRAVLEEAGADPERVARVAEGAGEHHGGAGEEQLTLDPAGASALREADRIAWATGAWHIRPGHVLLALAAGTETAAGRALRETGVPAMVPDRTARDLTRLALEGRLGRVTGRDHEIALTAAALAGPRRDVPVLLGHPGAGRTAVVEGLAGWIVDGGVPEPLRDLRIVQTDRPGTVLDRDRRLESLILFLYGLDDVRSLLTVQGPRIVLAATPGRYQEAVEADPALEERLVPVVVPALSPGETVAVLRRLRETYEAQLGVRFEEDALTAAAELAGRYLAGELPGQAVDLLERAGGRADRRPEHGPSGIEDLERRPMEAAGGAPDSRTPVTADDIASVVSRLAGVPVERLL